MTETEKKQLLKRNTTYWLIAMALPVIFDLGSQALSSGKTRFPWPIASAFLMSGLLLASNYCVLKACKSAGPSEVESSSVAGDQS